jgi:hypothetical protein
MADSSVAITAGSGTPIRVLTGLGTDVADQQVVTLADSSGNLLGGAGQPIPVSQLAASTPTITSPGSLTTTAAVVLAANSSRRGAAVFNESGAVLYLALGTTASLTAYTVQVGIGAYYEVPFNYTGALWGITTAGTAVVRVTELT